MPKAVAIVPREVITTLTISAISGFTRATMTVISPMTASHTGQLRSLSMIVLLSFSLNSITLFQCVESVFDSFHPFLQAF